MKTFLVINSSGRVTRSITRQLAERFVSKVLVRFPGSRIVHRDVGLEAPGMVNESWISAAYSGTLSEETPEALRESEILISELIRADVVVIGAPIYNFGMPAQLKAWIDQIVRPGKTFAFDPSAEPAYRPLLENKPVMIFSSAGDGAIHPGGDLWHMNHLEPHLQTIFGFIGLTDLRFIRVGYEEYQDERARLSLARAEESVDRFVEEFLPEVFRVDAERRSN